MTSKSRTREINQENKDLILKNMQEGGGVIIYLQTEQTCIELQIEIRFQPRRENIITMTRAPASEGKWQKNIYLSRMKAIEADCFL